MKVVLVNPPRTRYDLEELAPPLGLLRLARIARDAGAVTYVEDYNLLWHLDDRLQSAFYDVATERLLNIEADFYGFTSMAVDSHVALELARRIKNKLPHSMVVLGGTHFSSIASRVPEAFPWVDCVITGEGEGPLQQLLAGSITRSDSVPQPSDMSLPGPLYETVRLPAYFHVNSRRLVNLEAGRGCRYKCSFCYSPKHYTVARDFGTDQVITELASLPELGVRHVWFVEDNFLNNSKRAVSLCNAIQEAGLPLTWSCYATFPELSESVVKAFASAGCTEIFSGIDAVGTASERSFHKAFLRGTSALEMKTRLLLDHGIVPTYAFLVAPPSHPAGPNLGETVRSALDARALGANILLNPLTLYPGTLSREKFQSVCTADDRQAKLMMDLPEVTIHNGYVNAHPDLFPFHARYVGETEWRDFLMLTHCLATLVHTYPNTLNALLREKQTDPVAIARTALQKFSGWSCLGDLERRGVEQDVAFFVLEELTAGSRAAVELDAERPVIIGPRTERSDGVHVY